MAEPPGTLPHHLVRIGKREQSEPVCEMLILCNTSVKILIISAFARVISAESTENSGLRASSDYSLLPIHNETDCFDNIHT